MFIQVGRVRKTHVEDWLIETNLAEIDDFQDLPEQIFQDSSASLVMSKIETFLKQAIKSLREKYALQQM
ncbi:MAG: hypothetical protein R3B93_22900 [Bacteroidia bacterium]